MSDRIAQEYRDSDGYWIDLAPGWAVDGAHGVHACSACGGKGEQSCQVMQCQVCPDMCPVCLGAGRFSDQMPRRDAECDAFTLERYAYSWFGRSIDPEIGWHREGVKDALNGKDEILAAEYAQRCARGAFRAVPGLREHV